MKKARTTRWMTRTEKLPQGPWRFQDVPDDQLRRPEAWGSDKLSEFLDVATQNTYLTFNAHRGSVKCVIRYFELADTAARTFIDARRQKDAEDEDGVGHDVLFAFFIATQRSLYAAAMLIFSHQQSEAAKQLREQSRRHFTRFTFRRSQEPLRLGQNGQPRRHCRMFAAPLRRKKQERRPGRSLAQSESCASCGPNTRDLRRRWSINTRS